MKDLIKIGIPSKGRLRKDVLKIFNKNNLKLISKRGKRDLFGSVKGKPNMKIDFSHDWNDDPLVSTALHGIHAIPLVCEASPGFKSFLDLPLISSKFN